MFKATFLFTQVVAPPLELQFQGALSGVVQVAMIIPFDCTRFASEVVHHRYADYETNSWHIPMLFMVSFSARVKFLCSSE